MNAAQTCVGVKWNVIEPSGQTLYRALFQYPVLLVTFKRTGTRINFSRCLVSFMSCKRLQTECVTTHRLRLQLMYVIQGNTTDSTDDAFFLQWSLDEFTVCSINRRRRPVGPQYLDFVVWSGLVVTNSGRSCRLIYWWTGRFYCSTVTHRVWLWQTLIVSFWNHETNHL